MAKLLKIVFINLGFLVVFMLLVELVLRVSTPEWLAFQMNYISSSNQRDEKPKDGSDAAWPVIFDSLGYYLSFAPNESFSVNHIEYNHIVNTDDLGCRNIPFANKGVYPDTILCLGDSYLFGLGVSDEASFVNILQKGHNERLFNLGVNGTSIPHQLNILKKRIADFGFPKKVYFFFFTGNDYEDIFKYSIRVSQGVHSHKEYKKTVLFKWNKFLFHDSFFKYSYLLSYIKSSAIKVKFQQDKESIKRLYPVFSVMMKSNETYINSVTEDIRKYLEELNRLAVKHQFSPFFFIVPDKYSLFEEIRENKLSFYGIREDHIDARASYTLIQELLEEVKIDYFNPAECLKNKAARQEDIFYLKDDHFNSRGHLNYADCLLEYLSDSLHKEQR